MLRCSLNIWRSRPVGDTLVMRHPLTSNLATLDTGQTCTIHGTVTFGTFHGKAAANFAQSAYITLGTPFFDWTRGFTFAIWMYYGSSGGTRTMISAGDSNGGLSMSKNASNQYNTFGNTFSATIPTGAWHHVAATLGVDNKTINVYLDGSNVGTYIRAAAPGVGAISAMAIGGNVPGYTYNSKAVEMRDARIYATCMTDAEILALYQEG